MTVSDDPIRSPEIPKNDPPPENERGPAEIDLPQHRTPPVEPPESKGPSRNFTSPRVG